MFQHFYSQIGTGGITRPLLLTVQTTVVVAIIGGTILFFYYSFMPAMEEIKPKVITERLVVNSSSKGVCKVLTKDKVLESKIITNCNLKEGTEISIKYKEGFPKAQILENYGS